MARLAILLIRVYQLAISPLIPPACRFYPSCSHYAVGAYRHHGFLHGSWLTARRLAKCHPFHPGGVEPVPGTESSMDLDLAPDLDTMPDTAGAAPSIR